MGFFDLPLAQLETYRPEIGEPKDFDAFWNCTLAENPFTPELLVRAPIECGLKNVVVEDITFGGFGDAPIKGWFLRPANTCGSLPVVVEYVGYGGGRGMPEEHLLWPSAGYACFIMDTRGQGGSWGTGGATPDPVGGGPAAPGVMTSGIESPQGYYYRRAFVDAHHTIEAVAAIPEVDSARIAVAGSSQGGALAIAASALNKKVAATMANVPFLCHCDRAIGLATTGPYLDVVRFLSVNRDLTDRVFNTLRYFDCVNMAKRCSSPALFSTGLMDTTCPPSTVFAAKNWYGGDSKIEVYPFNAHEGGATYQSRRQVHWLGSQMGSSND